MTDYLDKDLLELTNEMEEMVQRLQAWNNTTQRSRNLSLAITNAESVVDKLRRVLDGE